MKVIPVGEGPEAHFEAEGQIRVGPAILSDSGAFLDKTSCGGPLGPFSETWLPLDVVFTSGCNLACRR